jgi:hypothetical protein
MLKRNAKAIFAAIYSGLVAAQITDWSDVDVKKVLGVVIAMGVGGGVWRIPNEPPA